MATTLEIETKFEVDADTTLPDLFGLPTVASSDPPRTQELTATYYDTAALTLLAAQITVRRRTGGDDPGWHVKVPARGEHARFEVQGDLGAPLDGAAAPVPDWVSEAVAGFVRGAPLVEVATLRTHRSVIRLRDESGGVVALLCDDVVDAWGSPQRPLEPVHWREWEWELAVPNDVLAKAGAARLLAAGARPSTVPNKLSRALARPAQLVGDRSPAPAASVIDALTPYLTTQAARLVHMDPLVRTDMPDAVHQMRVAARRLRAVLLGYDREFLPGRTAALRKDLGWLASELGRARDLEVLRERIRGTAAAGAADHGDLSAVDDQLATSREQAHRDASTAMSSVRYFALLDELAAFVDAPPWAERAHGAAAHELRNRLRRLWRQLDTASRELRHSVGTERALQLHELRRMAKRLRYCAEAAEPQLGADARRLADLLAELQDRLGRHHDAVLAQRLIETSLPGGSTSVAAARHQLAGEAGADDRDSLQLLKRMRHSSELEWLR